MSDSIRRFVRYRSGDATGYGELREQTIIALDAAPFAGGQPTGRELDVTEVSLLAPTAPSKLIAVGLNYRSHLGERAPLEYPGLFAKFPSSVIGHGEAIVMPADSESVHFEGEMVLVMGQEAKNLNEQQAREAIFGLTIGNDVSERRWQKNDLQWFRAKGCDTFAPLGPHLVTGLNPDKLALETRVNGEVKQQATTDLLMFNVGTIVSYISRYVTLLPGDVIYTGTPGKTHRLNEGDTVEVSLEGVGTLSNPVRRAAD